MTFRGRYALLAIALAVFAWLAPAASAGDLRLVEVGRASYPDRAFILTLPGKRTLTARDIQVRENGEVVGNVSLTTAGSTGADDTGVVLVIDASRSMQGAAIQDALVAARAFAERRPPNQEVGVVAFNRTSAVVLPLTSNDEEIKAALAKPPTLASGTHLYDGVDAALSLLDESNVPLGTVIVLSDGADTGSTATGSAVAAEARNAGVRVFTVGVHSPQFRSQPLRSLGSRTAGSYAEAASTADLARVYAQLGARLSSEYVLRYRSTSPQRRVRVAVRVDGIRGVAVSGYTRPPAGSSASDPYRDPLLTRIMGSPLSALVVSIMIAGLLAFSLFSLIRPRRRTLQGRMAEFVSVRAPQPGRAGDGEGTRLSSRVLVGAERSLETTKWWARFKETLELAEVRMTAVRVLLWTVAGTLLAAWLLAVITGSPILALPALAIPLVVRSMIFRRLERKRKAFSEQLPDNLQVLASALRAGHSLVGALSVVIDDADEPSKSEFRRVVGDEQLGVPLEDAIRDVVKRMDNDDLEQVALVAALQRRTGGNMAEVLERVTDTIRERFELRRMVQTLTAQGRMSRWVVTALPIGLLLVISAINPSYTKPLFVSSGGRIALMIAAAMLVAGSLVIKRIVNIKV